VVCPPSAGAEEAIDDEIVVVDDAPEPPPEDQTASVEVIRIDERPAGSSLADVLDEVSGVRVQRLGGLEAYATISIRGSSASQVLVLRDGVPLASASGAEVNLSEIPLDDIERIEVYRGPSAAHFGAGGLGGVVNLISRRPEAGARSRVDVGLGSFMPGSWDPERIFSFSARRSLALRTVAQGGERHPYSILASGGFWNTEGDFTYLDDNGTLWEARDDSFVLRQNNDASQGDLGVRVTVDLDPRWRLSLGDSTRVRSQGIPGLVDSVARLRTLQNLTFLELDRRRPGNGWPLFKADLFGRLRRDEWDDRDGEIGVSREHDDDLTLDVGGRLRAGWVLPRTYGSAWLLGEVRHERFFHRGLLSRGESWGWQRTTGSLGGWVTWRLAGGALELAPQARIDVISDGPSEGGPEMAGGLTPEASTRVLSSEQIGLRALPTSWLTLRASGGLTQRPPTFLELLGNRGSVVGNPLLEPESGWTVDGGLQLRWERLGRIQHLRFEATGFYRYVDDLIQLVPNSQVTFVAQNFGGATFAGLESSGSVRVDWASGSSSPWPGWVGLRFAMTYMDAVDRSDTYREGSQLPLRPHWEVYGRLAFNWGPLLLAYELEYVAGNYLQPSERFLVPDRLFHSLELTADLSRWRGPILTLMVRNLANRITSKIPLDGPYDPVRPVTDVGGFPLPGLTVVLTLSWDLGLLSSDRGDDDTDEGEEDVDDTDLDLASGAGDGDPHRGRL
jgi:iron complex outermembrane receptor protein